MNKNKSSIKLKLLPFSKLFPNIITILAICFGISAIRFSYKSQWELAVILILIAGFLDMLDGRVARYLKATSSFGAQLDSIADFANFGLAPALIAHQWFINDFQNDELGWAVVIIYIVSMAIRLARFNSELDDDDRPTWHSKFFTGVPAPAAAFLLAIPMMLSFRVYDIRAVMVPEIYGFYMLIISGLMVSRIPTFSSKKIIIKKQKNKKIF